ncbi:DUF485 domain-containing protein [Streptomyces sp. SCSIO 30461]|uniref:DUF485 domain-containing protein n=1 Tax=Streptomyces sp. SCSIO 30461 TaxID=3118085 RepID=UPI0030CAFC38
MEKQDCREGGAVRIDDPWYDALAFGWGESDSAGLPAASVPPGAGFREHRGAPADIYREVQRSAAFQEVRSRYRRFVIPATLVFFTWYVAYVITATTAPALMAKPVAGAVNVAMVAGLGQFLTTFLLTWAYARHARLRRDRAALDLRWTVFDQTREADLRSGTDSATEDGADHGSSGPVRPVRGGAEPSGRAGR